jgi:hypothetical protein
MSTTRLISASEVSPLAHPIQAILGQIAPAALRRQGGQFAGRGAAQDGFVQMSASMSSSSISGRRPR